MLDGLALEQTVIGHAINDPDCFQRFVSEVDWQHFIASNHKVIAFCIKQMATLGITKVDEDCFQLVVAAFPGEDKDYGGTDYIRQLQSAFTEKTDNYEAFIERLKLYGVKSKIANTHAQEIVRLCNDPLTTIDDLRNSLNQLNSDIEVADSKTFQFKDARQLSEEYIDNLDERLHTEFYSTGFTDLDEHLSEGFAPKQVTVMAGFTGMAKSTIAINMAHRIAVQGRGTALFSMESTDVSMMDKLVSTITQIPLKKLKKETADLTDREHKSIEKALESLNSLPLLINDQASLSIDGILYQIQLARRRGYNPEVIFIDLFGKIEDVDTGDNLATRIQKEMKRMRVLAKVLDVHFVCIVQIGRQGFGRQRGGRILRPTLIDIKNANAYGEEANIVLLLHRNKYYLPDLDDDILEIDIAKQRDGEANIKTYYEFFPDTSTILDTDKLPHDVVAA